MLQDLYWQDVFTPTAANAEMHSSGSSVTGGILEVTQIPPGQHSVYAFEMRRGQALHFSVVGNRRLDLLVCTFSEYERWLDSADADAEIMLLDAVEGVLVGSVSFQSAIDDEVVVVLSNSSEEGLQALVEALCD